MLTLQISGITPHSNTVPITGMLEAVVSELRKLRRLDDKSKGPIAVELASDYGRIKCTITDPETLEESLTDAPHRNDGEEWIVGYYVPTHAFLQMQEHTAVMDAHTQDLVATCGPSGDPASVRDACLFAISPKLYAMCREMLALATKGETAESLIPDLQQLLDQVPKSPGPAPAKPPSFE